MTAPFRKRAVNADRVAQATRETLPLAARQDDRYLVGHVYDVPLERLKANPANARALYSVSARRRLGLSLRARGQDTAATGYVDNNHEVTLIDGHRRWHACMDNGLPTLRVEIRTKPATEAALYLASRDANVEREDQSPLDDALVWRRLLERKVFPSQVALARTLGLSESEVSRTLALGELPPKVLQSLTEEPDLLKFKMLNALREYHEAQGEDRTLQLVIEAAKEGFGYREVEARRKACERVPVRRARSTRSEVAFRSAKGHLRLFEGGSRLELSIKGLSDHDSKELLERLQGALAPA